MVSKLAQIFGNIVSSLSKDFANKNSHPELVSGSPQVRTKEPQETLKQVQGDECKKVNVSGFIISTLSKLLVFIKPSSKMFLALLMLTSLSACQDSKYDFCVGGIDVSSYTATGSSTWNRYDSDIVNSYTVKANGNYSYVTNPQFDATTGNLISGLPRPNDPSYGQWLNTGIKLRSGDSLELSTTGSVSTCSTTGSVTMTGAPGRFVPITSSVQDWTQVMTDSGLSPTIVQPGDIVTIFVGLPNGQNGNAGNKWYSKDPLGNALLWNTQNHNLNTICSAGNASQCWYYGANGLAVAFTNQTAPGSSNISGQKQVGTDCAVTPSGNYYVANCTNTGQTGYMYMRADSGASNDNWGQHIGGYNAYVKLLSCAASGGTANATSGAGNLKAVIVNGGDLNNPEAGGALVYNDSSCASDAVLQQNDVGVTAGAFSGTAAHCGTLWLKMEDPQGTYSDNSGTYSVTVKTKVWYGAIAGIFQWLIDIVSDVAIPAAKIMAGQLMGETDYMMLVKVMVLLYMIFYCLYYIMGLAEINQLDFIIRMVKVGFLLTLISPQGLSFFNNFLFDFFSGGARFLIGIMTGHPGTSNPFIWADSTLGFLFSNGWIWLKIFSFLFTGIIGFVYVIMLFIGIWTLIKAIFAAALHYIMSLIAIALLMALAPIFFLFILFSPQGPLAPVRQLLDSYISYLVRYSLEPVVIILGLYLMNEVLKTILYPILINPICYKCAFNVRLDLPGISSSISLFCLKWFLPWGYDNDGGGFGMGILVQLLVNILLFMIVIEMMKHWQEHACKMVQMITGTFGYGGGVGGIKAWSGGHDGPSGSMKDNFMSLVGKGHDRQERLQEKKRGTYNSPWMSREDRKEMMRKPGRDKEDTTPTSTAGTTPTGPGQAITPQQGALDKNIGLGGLQQTPGILGQGGAQPGVPGGYQAPPSVQQQMQGQVPGGAPGQQSPESIRQALANIPTTDNFQVPQPIDRTGGQDVSRTGVNPIQPTIVPDQSGGGTGPNLMPQSPNAPQPQQPTQPQQTRTNTIQDVKKLDK